VKPKVYMETSVASDLTAWRGQDIVIAGNQETTRKWWDRRVISICSSLNS
jgi:hypothetical protein